jgi:hypothetical protein
VGEIVVGADAVVRVVAEVGDIAELEQGVGGQRARAVTAGHGEPAALARALQEAGAVGGVRHQLGGVRTLDVEGALSAGEAARGARDHEGGNLLAHI